MLPHPPTLLSPAPRAEYREGGRDREGANVFVPDIIWSWLACPLGHEHLDAHCLVEHVVNSLGSLWDPLPPNHGGCASAGAHPLPSIPAHTRKTHIFCCWSVSWAGCQPRSQAWQFFPQHPLGHSDSCPVLTPDDVDGPRASSSLSLQRLL